MMTFPELSKQEQRIYLRLDRLLRDMKNAGFCIFVNDGTLEVYRGEEAPHTRFDGSVDNEQSIISFISGGDYCSCDGGATL